MRMEICTVCGDRAGAGKCAECNATVCADRACVHENGVCTLCVEEYCAGCKEVPLSGYRASAGGKVCDECHQSFCDDCMAIMACQSSTGICQLCCKYECESCGAGIAEAQYVWDGDLEYQPLCDECRKLR